MPQNLVLRLNPGFCYSPPMDDGFIDESTIVDVVGNGRWKYFDQPMSDSHVKGNGIYDIRDVLAESSNVGASKLITKYYGKRYSSIFNHLKMETF